MTTDPQSAPTPDVGDVLGDRYRLDRFIASGAMGRVFEATDRSLGRRVAIKIARLRRGMDDELEKRLLLEARAAAKLQGTHVAHIFEIGRLPSGTTFVVMEYLEGENLEQVRERRGRVAVADAVQWALETCLALAEAHAMGIVHRDIKPENLFLTETPDGAKVLKVLDFGASAFVATRWKIGPSREIHMGTPLYMAPERIEDAGSSDPRSDIWALGAVLYELIGGRAPFDSEEASVEEVVRRTLEDDPEPLGKLREGVPDSLDRAVLRCLAKSPSRRFPDVAELATALGAAGRPGAHGLAARVRHVRDRARSKKQEEPTPVAESSVPKARAPMPSAPLPLTAPTAPPRPREENRKSEPLPLTPALSPSKANRS